LELRYLDDVSVSASEKLAKVPCWSFYFIQ